MNTKNILITVFALIVMVIGLWYVKSKEAKEVLNDERIMIPEGNTEDESNGVKFSGKLEEVNTGCFADGECYVVVDGKHVTTTMGWTQGTLGSIKGVEGFGDLESLIGQDIEVYAKDKGDGTYTLYGSSNFYVEVK